MRLMRRSKTPATASRGRKFALPPLKALAVPALLLTVVLLLVGYFLTIKALAPAPDGREVGLDVISRMTAARQITSARFLDEDSVVSVQANYDPRLLVGPLAGAASTERLDGEFWAAYPKSDTATADLIESITRSGADLHVDRQVRKSQLRFVAQFLLPLLILASLFAALFVLIRGGGAGEFGLFSQIAARRRGKGDARITFDNVGAAGEAIAELAEIRDYLEDPTKYREMGALAPKGVLLVGPPGTGKTLLARAIAGEANVPFFFISGSEFVESLVGVGAARVRSLFKQVRAVAPAIVFIDELDAAGRQRGAGLGQGNDEREQTLNQMLVEMDGFDPASGVVVIGATNRPDILDPALLRPGRFDRQIVIDVPDVIGRIEILSLYAKDRPMEPGVSLEKIAKACPGFSGAELAGLMNESALLAVRAGKLTIGQDELEEALDRVVSGPARKSHILTDEERRILAVHESGHAIVACAVDLAAGIHKISIVARGRNLGHTSVLSDADRLVRSEQDLFNEVVATMAGSAAELLILGRTSTASEVDLRKATDLARDMVCSFGLSPSVGRVAVGTKAGEVFLGRDMTSLGNLSESLLTKVDQETANIVKRAEDEALRQLRAQHALLEQLSGRLFEEETISGDELAALLKVPDPRPRARRNGRAAAAAVAAGPEPTQ